MSEKEEREKTESLNFVPKETEARRGSHSHTSPDKESNAGVKVATNKAAILLLMKKTQKKKEKKKK